jgi:hypothetical protein
VIDINDQGEVKASSYREYAPSLLQLVEDFYSVHIDFETYSRISERNGPMIEAGDAHQPLAPWMTYY